MSCNELTDSGLKNHEDMKRGTKPDFGNRMELSANLIDSSDRTILLPYNPFPIREGFSTLTEAENRVFITAEQGISNEYKEILSEYLSRILPVR